MNTNRGDIVNESRTLSPVILAAIQAIVIAVLTWFNISVDDKTATLIANIIGAVVYIITLLVKAVKIWNGVKTAATTTQGLPGTK